MPNSRRCPFYGCTKMIDPSLFACRHHWPTLDDDDRCEVWRIYTAYLKGEMHIDELVRRQHEIMLKNTPQTDPSARSSTAVADMEFVKEVSRYIALRKEYSKTKDGFLERKQKLGMQLSHLESVIAKKCHAILHPEQKQPTLFDGGDAPKTELPD